jgi:hypothetical protein
MPFSFRIGYRTTSNGSGRAQVGILVQTANVLRLSVLMLPSEEEEGGGSRLKRMIAEGRILDWHDGVQSEHLGPRILLALMLPIPSIPLVVLPLIALLHRSLSLMLAFVHVLFLPIDACGRLLHEDKADTVMVAVMC